MKNKKLLRIFAAVIVFAWVVLLPVLSYALTYNQFMVETLAGEATVTGAANTIGAAYGASRLILGLNIVGGTVALGLLAWDAYNMYKDNVVAENTVTARAAYSAVSPTSDGVGYGVLGPYSCTQTQTLVWDQQPCGSNQVLGYVDGSRHFTVNTPACAYNNASYVVVGGMYTPQYTQVTFYQCNVNAQTGIGTWGAPSTQKRELISAVQYTYYALETTVQPTTVASPYPSPTTVSNPDPLDNTNTAIQTIQAAKTVAANANTALQTKAADPLNNGYPSQPWQGPTVPNNWVPFTMTTSYTVNPNQGPLTGTDPSSLPVPTPPSTMGPPPPISDGTCGPCSRAHPMSEVQTLINSMTPTIPLLALLNKISMSNTGQTWSPIITFSLPLDGPLPGDHSVNLDDYGFEIVLTCFRFVILAGAVIFSWSLLFT